MLQKFLAAFAILALVVASAGTVPAPGSSFRVTLSQPSVVKGSELKAGAYRINIGVEKVTFVSGRTAVDASARSKPEAKNSTPRRSASPRRAERRSYRRSGSAEHPPAWFLIRSSFGGGPSNRPYNHLFTFTINSRGLSGFTRKSSAPAHSGCPSPVTNSTLTARFFRPQLRHNVAAVLRQIHVQDDGPRPELANSGEGRGSDPSPFGTRFPGFEITLSQAPGCRHRRRRSAQEDLPPPSSPRARRQPPSFRSWALAVPRAMPSIGREARRRPAVFAAESLPFHAPKGSSAKNPTVRPFPPTGEQLLAHPRYRIAHRPAPARAAAAPEPP